MATLQAIDRLLSHIDNDKKRDVASGVPSFKLNHHHRNINMPAIGFGLYNVTTKDIEKVTLSALKTGYRHFDGASFYGNEKAFGAVLRKHKISRNEVFITSKVWNNMHGYENTLKSFHQSLKDLDCEYIDLYLIHWPVPKVHTDSWRALEKLYYDQKCRAIGVSNYLKSDFEELLAANAKNKNFIKPSVNQLCINPLYYQPDLFEYFQKEHNVIVQAYKPLERADDKLLKNEKILKMSQKYGITPAQVCLKWGFQYGFVELVKTSSANRMVENVNAVFLNDFDNKDMECLNSLTTDLTIDEWHKRYIKRKNGM